MSVMKKCEWKKVKLKTISLSEWQCTRCGKTGYASHEKPPVNCLQPNFGFSFNHQLKSKNKLFDKFTSSKEGGYSLSFLIVILLIVFLTAISHYKCNFYQIIDFSTAECRSASTVDEIYKEDFADGLSEVDGNANLCEGIEYVDYSDVEKYFGMLRNQMDYLDYALNDNEQKYSESHKIAYDMNAKREVFFNEKIKKCFGGDKGHELVIEVSRMQNFVSEKMKQLHELAYK